MEALFIEHCAIVQPGDWVGVMQPSAPVPVATLFTTTARLLLKNSFNPLSTGGSFQIGNVTSFDMLTLPYVVLLASYLSTGNTLTIANLKMF